MGRFIKRRLLRRRRAATERALLEPGLLAASEQGLAINAGTEMVFSPPGEEKGSIYLAPMDDGLDVSKLYLMGAETHPELARRYVALGRLLRRHS